MYGQWYKRNMQISLSQFRESLALESSLVYVSLSLANLWLSSSCSVVTVDWPKLVLAIPGIFILSSILEILNKLFFSIYVYLLYNKTSTIHLHIKLTNKNISNLLLKSINVHLFILYIIKYYKAFKFVCLFKYYY